MGRGLGGLCADNLGLLPVPGQALIEALGRMLGDTGEHVGEPGLRIDAIHFRRDDQRVHEGGSVTATVGAGEQPGLPAEGAPEPNPNENLWQHLWRNLGQSYLSNRVFQT